MLIQFSFKNFKVFKEEVLLDFLPASINEHKNTLLKDPADGECILPLIGIYGPNSGGKSTVLNALSCLSSLVTASVTVPTRIKDVHCLFSSDCKDIPTQFDVLFRSQGFLFRYQLQFLKGNIAEENLFYGSLGGSDTGILFNRKESVIHPGRELISFPLKAVPPSVTLLSWLNAYTDSMHAKAAYSWFSRIQGSSPRELPSDADTRRRLCGILQDLGLDIADYSIIPDSDHKSPAVILVHSPYEGCTYELPWEEESMGTKKLLSLLPSVLASLDDGSLMMADDLDCILHPHALRYLIALYANRERNPHNAQLLFTAHNTAILQPAQMRRDEIWLCCRQEGQDTELYPLSSYKKENGLIPRNDEAYGKQYLEGRYGAMPNIHA